MDGADPSSVLDTSKLLPDAVSSSIDFGKLLTDTLTPGGDAGKAAISDAFDPMKLLPENVTSVIDMAKRIPGNPFQSNDTDMPALPPYLAMLPSGNRWLFYIFQIFNLAVTLSSTAQFVASTFLVVSLGQVTWSSLGFLVNGGVSLLLGLLGPVTRHYNTVLIIYNTAMTTMASVQTGFAVAAAIWAEYPKRMDSGLEDLFRYGMLIPGALQFLTSLFSWFYKCSFVSNIHLEAVLPALPNIPALTAICQSGVAAISAAPGLEGISAEPGLPGLPTPLGGESAADSKPSFSNF